MLKAKGQYPWGWWGEEGGRGLNCTSTRHSFVCDRLPYMKFEFVIVCDLSCGQVDISVQKVFGGHFPKLGSVYR